jgi:CBS domain containing-hemolysin-like protein
MTFAQATGIVLSLLFAALFSCLEIAFIASNKLHIQFLDKKGIFSGRILYRFVKNPSAFVGMTLIGYVLAMVVYALLAAESLYAWLLSVLPSSWESPLLSLPLLSLLLFFPFLLVAEFLPKLVFLVNPDSFLQFLSVPVRLLHYALYPLIAAMSALSRWVVTHILRIPQPPDGAVFNLSDLNLYLTGLARRKDDKEEPEVDTEIFNNALRFKTVRVRECMVPRTEITAVEAKDKVSELRKAFLLSGHSRVVVYKDNIDNIIGYCHALDLFKKPKEIQSLIEPIPVVSESTPVSELLVRFTSEKKTLALVVDEFGGTSGLVSLEDVMDTTKAKTGWRRSWMNTRIC